MEVAAQAAKHIQQRRQETQRSAAQAGYQCCEQQKAAQPGGRRTLIRGEVQRLLGGPLIKQRCRPPAAAAAGSTRQAPAVADDALGAGVGLLPGLAAQQGLLHHQPIGCIQTQGVTGGVGGVAAEGVSVRGNLCLRVCLGVFFMHDQPVGWAGAGSARAASSRGVTMPQQPL